MSRWPVADGDGDEVFVVEAIPGGGVSLHIPSPKPIEVRRAVAEKIRLAIGAALGEGDDGS